MSYLLDGIRAVTWQQCVKYDQPKSFRFLLNFS